MIILKNYKFLVKWLGLEPFRLNNVRNNSYAFCYLISALLDVAMYVGNLILNMNDMEETINSLITLAGSLVGLTFVIYVLLNSDRFTSLEKDLQDIVDESKCEKIRQKIPCLSK